MASHPQDRPTGATTPAQAADRNDVMQSVAGEEDPGAAFDAVGGAQANQPSPSMPRQPRMRPGDAAPAGAPGTGENVCPRCGGSGRQGASHCPDCGGTGKIIAAIGGA